MRQIALDSLAAHAPQETLVNGHRLPEPANDPSRWRVAKKIGPGQRGAVKLARTYGEALVCLRYRENDDGTERLTTGEPVVERAVIQKRDDPVVALKIKPEEIELRRLAQARGAKYDGKNFMWKLARSQVLRMGLKARIAVRPEDLYQEQVPT
jgi:hypothetical protein